MPSFMALPLLSSTAICLPLVLKTSTSPCKLSQVYKYSPFFERQIFLPRLTKDGSLSKKQSLGIGLPAIDCLSLIANRARVFTRGPEQIDNQKSKIIYSL